MADRELRVWCLVRGVSDTESLAFINVVLVEKAGSDYAATVLGTDGRIVAMGRNEDEAVEEAIDLFTGMVDHTIEQRRSLEVLLGEAQCQKLNVPVSRAHEVMAVFDQHMERLRDQFEEVDEWRATPVTGYLSLQEVNV